MLRNCAGNEDKSRVCCGDNGISESADEPVMPGPYCLVPLLSPVIPHHLTLIPLRAFLIARHLPIVSHPLSLSHPLTPGAIARRARSTGGGAYRRAGPEEEEEEQEERERMRKED